MKRYNTLLLVAFSCLFSACGPSYKILKTDKEKDFKLSNYPTFGFYEVDASGDTIADSFGKNIAVIKDAIASSLKEKGLNESQEPALKINIAIVVTDKVQTRQTNFQNDGRPYYMGQRRYSWKSEEVPVGNYRQGTMLIDLVDAATNKMVWKGGAEGVLSEKPEEFAPRINGVVKDIFHSLDPQ